MRIFKTHIYIAVNNVHEFKVIMKYKDGIEKEIEDETEKESNQEIQ